MNNPRCPNCENQLEAGHAFCSQCGTKVLNSGTGRRPRGGWTVLLLVLLSLGGFTAGLSGIFRQGELENVVENQLNSIKSNHYTEAYYEYTTKEFQENTNLEAFRTFVKAFPPFSHNTAIQFKKREVQDGKGIVEAILVANDGEEIKVDYRLAKENGKWKIMGIEVLKS